MAAAFSPLATTAEFTDSSFGGGQVSAKEAGHVGGIEREAVGGGGGGGGSVGLGGEGAGGGNRATELSSVTVPVARGGSQRSLGSDFTISENHVRSGVGEYTATTSHYPLLPIAPRVSCSCVDALSTPSPTAYRIAQPVYT